MANTTGYRDCYALMNAVAKQALGTDDIAVIDTSSFVTVGEAVLRTGTESVMDAISQVLSETIFSVRPYSGKLTSLMMDGQRWGERTRKITPLYNEAEQDTAYNTPTRENLVDGQTIDHYKQHLPKAMELSFYGSQVLQKSITRFADQVSNAFTGEAQFMSFIDAVMVEFYNEVELLNEGKRRATLVNFMGGISSMGLTEVDLVAAFNDRNGTTLTRAQLLSKDHITEFCQFVVSTIKTDSGLLTELSENYHAQITGKKVLRHTPKSFQKLIMYGPIWNDVEASVYSTVFHPDYLKIGEFEKVNFWQSINDPTEIKVKPNILDVATGESKTAEADVELPYVLGVLFDRDAVGVVTQFERSVSTPLNASGLYTNTFWHWRFQSVTDYTENAILYVLGAGGE